MKRFVKPIVSVIVFGGLLLSSPFISLGAEQELSPGVSHVEENTTVFGLKQNIQRLEVDLTDPYTTIDVGIPSPFPSLKTTTSLAKENTYLGHQVVGAVNASFFDFSSRLPSYLLAQDDQIVNLGAVSAKENNYMYTPAAFGITKEGRGRIGKMQMDLNINANGKTFTLDGLNRVRSDNDSVLFTKSYRWDKTRTNQFGLEVVVEGLATSPDTEARFGQTLTGKVAGVRPYGQYTSATIPENGFVISVQGDQVDYVRNLKQGDPVSLTIDVDEAWRNAEFILASGPLLVQNGQVDLTIDENSSRATTRSPRTAVATRNNGNEVFLVTVDGRQRGYSEGMTLPEFARYLDSLGVEQAMNLDGGGSTTMATRSLGQPYVSLANRPSDGAERGISTILQAVNTAPKGIPEVVEAKAAEEGILAVGASVDIAVEYVLDQYDNLLGENDYTMTYEVTNDLGSIEGSTFQAERAGSGTILVRADGAQTEIPVKVVDEVDNLRIEPSKLMVGTSQTVAVSAKASMDGENLIFNEDQVVWATTGSIGTIDQSGTFRSTSEGKGTIEVWFGNQSASIPVVVSNDPISLGNLHLLDGLEAKGIRSKTSLLTSTDVPGITTNPVMQLDYDFRNTQGTSASYVTWKQSPVVNGKPESVGLWVYGDGKSNWLRGRIEDGNGNEQRIDFTADNGLDWYGWKYVRAQLPENITAPITFKELYIAETEDAAKSKGTLYFDGLQAEFVDEPPVYFSSAGAKSVNKDKVWTITFTTSMSDKSLQDGQVYVQKQNGTRIPISIEVVNSKQIKVSSSAYETGEAYQLVISKHAKSTSGRLLKEARQQTFIIE